MLAEGSMPRLPVSMEASSEMMSPKMLPVIIVSNTLGFLSSCMAALSTYLQEQAGLSEALQDTLRALQVEAARPVLRCPAKRCAGRTAWENRGMLWLSS